MLYFLLCTYISLYYIRPFEWIDAFRNSQIFLIVGVVSILALLLSWATGQISLFRYKTDVMMAGFSFAIIMSHLIHGYFGGAYESMLDFLPAFVGYFLVAHALNSAWKIKWFIFLLIGLTLFLSYQAFMQSIFGVASGGLKPIFETSYNAKAGTEILMRVRWYGMFNDPNDLGLALVLPIPFLVNCLFERKFLFAVSCLVPLLCAIYLTNSRGAILSICASIFVYLTIRFRSTKGAIVGVFLAFLLVTLGPSRMSQLSSTESSAYGRIEAWYAGFQMFKSSPLFGVGARMFTDHYIITAHNTYMLVLAELGFVGSFFFVGFFYFPCRWIYKNIFQQTNSLESEKRRLLLAACFSSLIGLMTATFFLSRAYILLPFMFTALLTATINMVSRQSGATFRGGDAVAEHFYLGAITGWVLIEIVGINLLVKLMI